MLLKIGKPSIVALFILCFLGLGNCITYQIKREPRKKLLINQGNGHDSNWW